jgi:tetratricopeptide (TPR) repeat protein
LIVLCSCLLIAGIHPAISAGSELEWNSKGVDAYNRQDWENAVRMFRESYRLAPTNDTITKNFSNALQAWASQLANNKHYADATSLLEEVIVLEPKSVSPLVQLGAYYLRNSSVKDAIFRLEEAIELAPGNTDAHYLLGEAYYRDNDVSSAIDQWEWVFQVEPKKPGLKDRLESALREEQVEYNFHGDSSHHFNVTYSREAERRQVREVLRILESAYQDIGGMLGRVYPANPIQVTLYTADGFSESTQMGEHVGALFDGTKIRCPIMDKQGNTIPKAELQRRLYHEYVHVLVRHLAQQNAPWWLNEGLAESLSKEFTATESKTLKESYRKKSLHSLETLESSQLEKLSPEELRLAYYQSHMTVNYIRDRYGLRNFNSLLTSLGEGVDPEVALRNVFRFNYQTLDLAVADAIQSLP